MFIINGFKVTSPNGGEQLVAGTQHTITWKTEGDYPDGEHPVFHRQRRHRNDYAYVIMNTGSYPWPVPSTVSSQCLIRVRAYPGGVPLDTSDAPFSIVPVPDTLTLTSPNGGEIWDAGSVHTITWNSTGIGVPNVRIYFSTGGPSPSQWYDVILSTPNDGAFDWIVPNAVNSDCYVMITDAVDGIPFDLSNANFAIGGFHVTSPEWGVQWAVGTQQTITWGYAGNFPTVRIELSTNNGSTWMTITSGAPNTGIFFPWTPASEMVSSQCLVKVSDSVDGFPSDTSDAVFLHRS